ncbi:MAG: hypothetical protein VKJ04_10480 [Vampirovibrionales bacterium]|nr:hypothetical protein [Vampirovibrionales bacterium]
MKTALLSLTLAAGLLSTFVLTTGTQQAAAEGVSTLLGAEKTPLLLAFDGFDDDEGSASSATDEGPASDDSGDGLMDDGSGGSWDSGSDDNDRANDPDADPGFGVGFDPDKE